jgi:cytochrome c oxidase assembly factor CtaG
MPASPSLIVAHALSPHDGLRTWTFEPTVVVPLALVAIWYGFGVARVWREAGRRDGISVRQAAAFAAGWIALVVALVSPVDAISESLFSVHMLQHELLIIVAAPLIAIGAPLVAMLWALPPSSRRTLATNVRRPWIVALWTAITAPATVWLLHAAALWVWHMPPLYDAAVEHEAVHALQHLCFFGTAALFWWGLMHGRYGRLGYGAAVLYVFATGLHSGVLGALLTLSPRVLYTSYGASAAAWGLSPLEDQQLAGLIMWVPAGLVFTGVGLGFLGAWIQESERRVRLISEPRAMRSIPPVILLMLVVAGAWACDNEAYRSASALTNGDPERGREAIVRYGCDTCHTIPGVRTARGLVGPPLNGIAARVYLAGHLPNTPQNMEQWVRHPRSQNPHTAMPEMGVTDADGRDIAAYLYTLR